MHCRYRHAFTILEILVSLAIIAIIAAIAFPMFAASREDARRRVCASIEHQWGLAFAMYIADYNGAEPVAGTDMTHSQLGLPPASFQVGFGRLYKLSTDGRVDCPSVGYYGPLNKSQAGYTMDGFNDSAPPSTTLGPKIRLMECTGHNGVSDLSKLPVGTREREQILYIDQRIEMIQNGIP